MSRCRHSWTEVDRTYAPRTPSSFDVKGVTNDELLALVYGATFVELRCEDCGDLTSRVLPGDHTKREVTA